jgi:hypothetical protein
MSKFFKLTGRRQWSNLPIRLAMSLLVKNEEDLIEANIRYHASVGVDKFIVMDNGSSDDTYDIVNNLKSEFDIELISKPIMQYKQSDWATYMAKLAQHQFSCDWFIANDADEFWVPKSESLKSEMARSKSILQCTRYDMQLTFSTQNKPFYERIWRTHHPVLFSKQEMINEPLLSMNLGKINGKVAVNLYGLIRSKSGNHHAWHLKKYRQENSNNITVYHYPIGSYNHFKWMIENRRELIQNDFDRATPNYKRWLELKSEDKTQSEYKQMELTDNEIQVLEKFGVIKEDCFGRDKIRAVLEWT